MSGRISSLARTQELIEQLLSPENAIVFHERMELFNNFRKPRVKGPVSYAADGTLRYTCTYSGCGREFSRNEHFKRHALIHTGEKPYVCPLCLKTFNRTDNLAEHINIHLRSLLRKREEAGKDEAAMLRLARDEIRGLLEPVPVSLLCSSPTLESASRHHSVGDGEEEDEEQDSSDERGDNAAALLSLGQS